LIFRFELQENNKELKPWIKLKTFQQGSASAAFLLAACAASGLAEASAKASAEASNSSGKCAAADAETWIGCPSRFLRIPRFPQVLWQHIILLWQQPPGSRLIEA